MLPRFDVPADIVADFLARLELNIFGARIVLNMSFPTAIEAFEASLQPRHAGFHKTDAQVGILIEDAVEDNAGERHHLADGMAEAVDRRVGREPIHARVLRGRRHECRCSSRAGSLRRKTASILYRPRWPLKPVDGNMTPQKFSSVTARRISLIASSGSCSGTNASP